MREIHAIGCSQLCFKARRDDQGWRSLIDLDFVPPASRAAMFVRINFQPVFGNLKPHLASYFHDQLLQLLALKFMDLVGLNIQQIVMFHTFDFKPCLAIANSKFLDELIIFKIPKDWYIDAIDRELSCSLQRKQIVSTSGWSAASSSTVASN